MLPCFAVDGRRKISMMRILSKRQAFCNIYGQGGGMWCLRSSVVSVRFQDVDFHNQQQGKLRYSILEVTCE
jgi:hypothetical protein